MIRAEPTAKPPSRVPNRKSSVARLSIGGAWAAHDDPVHAAFREWTMRYVDATSASARAELEEGGAKLAEARRRLMEDLVVDDPGAALAIAIPAHIWTQLPPSVLAHVEGRVSGPGELIVAFGCSPEEGITERWTTVLVSGRSYQADVLGHRGALGSRAGLSVHGVTLGDRLVLHDSPVLLLGPPRSEHSPVSFQVAGERHVAASLTDLVVLEEQLRLQETAATEAVVYSAPETELDEEPEASLLPPRLAGATGNVSVLVIRAKFRGDPSHPVSAQSAASVMDQVDQYFADWSRGRLSISAVVTGDYELPEPDHHYAFFAPHTSRARLHEDAREKASADHDLASYDRIAVLFRSLARVDNPYDNLPLGVLVPRFQRPGWAVGPHIWLNGSIHAALVAHELGHTFGLEHAMAWDANGTAAGPGNAVDYGDGLDIMGGGTQDERHHPNPFYSYALQWLDDPEVEVVEASGRHRVHRFDHVQASGVQALVVPRGEDRTYWIGLRQSFPDRSSLLRGAYVIWGARTTAGTSSLLLDMSPTTPSSFEEPGLALGSTFEDMEFGIRMRVVEYGGIAPDEYVDVEIDIDIYPPRISTPLEDATPYVGDRFVFSVDAHGSRPLSYKWFKDGESLPSEVTHELDLDALSEQDSGSYSVSVSNALGDVVSGPVQLTVRHRPAGLQWRSRYDNVVRKGDDVTLRVGMDSGAPAQISWFRGDEEIQGAHEKELIVGDEGLYRCVVDNGDGGFETPFRVSVVADCAVIGWGSNLFGEGDSRADLERVVAIDAVSSYCVALGSDGTVQAWGNGRPASGLASLTDVVAISAGSVFSLAVTADGRVYKWNRFLAPVVIPDLVEITAVATGPDGTQLALKRDGSVEVIWFGDPSMLPPPDLGFVVDLAIGQNHAIALLEDLTVVVWGAGAASLADVSNLQDVVAIAAGGFHALALHEDGTLSAWGESDHGQASVPAELSDPANARVRQIGAGSRHSLVVRNRWYRPPWVDDTLPLELAVGVEAWGQNADGETAVPRLPAPFAVAAGATHSLALVERRIRR